MSCRDFIIDGKKTAVVLSITLSSQLMAFNISDIEVKKSIDFIYQNISNGKIFPKRNTSRDFGGLSDPNVVKEDGVGVVLLGLTSSDADALPPALKEIIRIRDRYLSEYELQKDSYRNVWEYIKDNGKTQEDTTLANYVLSATGMPTGTCETGFGGDPYDGSILCSNKNLTELAKGWSYLKSINGKLDLSNNGLTSIDPLSNLSYASNMVDLSGNSISSLSPLGKLDAMILKVDNVPYSGKISEDAPICNKGGAVIVDQNEDYIPLSELRSNICEYSGKRTYLPFKNESCYTGYKGPNHYGDIKCTNLDDLVLVGRGWASLVRVQGSLSFWGSYVEEVSGLINLKEVSGKLDLTVQRAGYFHDAAGDIGLTDVSGLASLTKVGRSFNLEFTELCDLNGISSIQYVGYYATFSNNRKLSDIRGLSNLTYVGGGLMLSYNPNLKNLNGLNPNLKVKKFISIDHDPSLTDISGLNGVIAYGGARVPYGQSYSVKIPEDAPLCVAGTFHHYNESQYEEEPVSVSEIRSTICEYTGREDYYDFGEESCFFGFKGPVYDGDIDCAVKNLLVLVGRGWASLKKVNGNLDFLFSPVQEIVGLKNLTEVVGKFNLESTEITDLRYLSSLTRVGNSFNVSSPNLSSLHGLENLREVGRNLGIGYSVANPLDLSPLSSLTYIGRTFSLRRAHSLNGLNPNLTIGKDLLLDDDPYLTDISFLSNITVNGNIRLDDREYDVKMPSTSPYCNDLYSKIQNVSQKSYICET